MDKEISPIGDNSARSDGRAIEQRRPWSTPRVIDATQIETTENNTGLLADGASSADS